MIARRAICRKSSLTAIVRIKLNQGWSRWGEPTIPKTTLFLLAPAALPCPKLKGLVPKNRKDES
eukprot:5431582-Pleurochrysis_carterae.AAC.1